MPRGIDPDVYLAMPFMGTYSSDNYETVSLLLYTGYNNGHRFYFTETGQFITSCIGSMAQPK
jgi:hypothetical protein